MNHSSAQKFSLPVSLNKAVEARIIEQMQKTGKNLPASIVSINGQIATIKFEILDKYNLPQISVPVIGNQYFRAPLQAGDKGTVIACDASIWGVTGQNQQTSDLSTPGNLSALFFVPLGNATWSSVDPDMAYVTGRKDVMLRDNSHQIQLEDLNLAFTNLITALNVNFAVIGPLLTTPTALTPIPATDNPVKVRVP